jgi:adenylate cyclase
VTEQTLTYARELARLHRLNQSYRRRLPETLDEEDVGEAVVHTATALFTDLRGFTGLGERYADDPAGLLAIVNAHLTVAARAIMKCGGTVEKFVGDGVFATFGAHFKLPEHAERALAAGMACVGANEALNRRNAAAWGFRLDVGVGIATGKVVVGNIGAPERSEYGILGDPVNIAARLVERAKAGELLITDGVYGAIAEHVRADLAGLSPVRGRRAEVNVYRISLLQPVIP